MNAEKQKKIYLGQVTKVIRNASVCKEVETELSDHIDERFELLLTKNMCEEEAMRLTLVELGEPTKLGISFKVVHSPCIFRYYIAFSILTVYLYTGSVWSFVDFSSILFVTAAAMGITYFITAHSKRWYRSKRNWESAFFGAGIAGTAISFISGLGVVEWSYIYWNIALLPLWYGLAFRVLLGSADLRWKRSNIGKAG